MNLSLIYRLQDRITIGFQSWKSLRYTMLLIILKRRRRYFITSAAAVFVLSLLLFALHWSNYRSTATVQIEQSNVSHTLAAPTGTNPEDMVEALADQRISQVEQTVTSIDSLGAIIDKYKLYGGQRQSTPIAVLATKNARQDQAGFYQ